MDAETKQGQGAPAARPSTISKHTPGPWVAEETPQSSNQDWVVMRDVSPGKRRTQVASIDFQYGDAEQEANAKLIAAAPALADALEQAAKYLRGGAPIEMALDAIDAALRAAGRLDEASGNARGARPQHPTPSPKARP